MDFKRVLDSLTTEGNLRRLPQDLPDNYVDFTSNDYLGLATDPKLAKDFISQISDFRFSSSASRLLASHQESYKTLESFLGKEYGKASLLYNSGYHANTGVIPAVASDSKCLILIDKLVHASIIDGVILSRCEFRRFPHNDIIRLKKIIEKNYNQFDRILVITESIFSMDGDFAPLDELLDVKDQFPKIILYLDEAHAFGVKGRKGLGRAQDSKKPGNWDIIVAPMGKAAASVGAFVICSDSTKEFLINKSRSLIFSTAIPPIQIKWSLFVIQKLLGMDKQRAHLEFLSSRLSNTIETQFKQKTTKHSHIQPLIIGDSHRASKISDLLYQSGIKALPIRKPTVPAGTERLRFSLSASMEEKDIEKLDYILREIRCKESI